MKIRHQDLEIEEESPFATCQLNRQRYAEVLTEIVDTYADGFVLAINNEWGTGKTTFVKMWRQMLSNKGFKTVYFNAWENDFDNDPLTAIVAELKNLTGKNTEKVYKSIIEKGAAIGKAVLPSALKTLSKGVVDIEAASTAVENLTKAATETFDAQIKDYLKKKDSMKGFRTKLEEFVAATDDEKPIIFIIDELDRCRPDYAVKVLEHLKHFFAVPGIVFALTIDKGHLAAAVRGFYGTESIDTDEYLRRFIDLEYSIPSPSSEEFTKYLYSYYEFDQFFTAETRRRIDDFRHDSTNFINMASSLFSTGPSTLRQMERIMARTRLVLNLFRLNNYVFPEVLLLMVYLSTTKPTLYKKIQKEELSVQELCDELEILFLPINTKTRGFLLYVLAEVAGLYQNQTGQYGEQLIERDEKHVTAVEAGRRGERVRISSRRVL